MAQALQSAQQSLSQAGPNTAQGKEPSDEEWGKQPGEGQQGQPGQQGQQGQQGQGQGQGQQGQGQQGQGQGQGQPGQSGQQASSGNGQGMGGPGRGQGGSAGKQDPLAVRKKDHLIKGQVNQRGQQLSRKYKDNPDLNPSSAAYVQAYPEFKKAAESAMQREEIPLAHRKQVRDYFDAITPKTK